MKKWEENKDGIADALKAMWEDCQKGDFEAAVEEFAMAQSLADDDAEEEGEMGEGGEMGGEEKGKGLLVAVLGKKPDK